MDQLGNACLKIGDLGRDRGAPADGLAGGSFETWLSRRADEQPYLSVGENLENQALIEGSARQSPRARFRSPRFPARRVSRLLTPGRGRHPAGRTPPRAIPPTNKSVLTALTSLLNITFWSPL